MTHLFARIGAVFCAAGVGCGAFGSHGLREKLTPAMFEVYKTGVLYHLVHALGLLLIALLAHHYRNRFVRMAGWATAIGIVLFSGSLYLLAITGIKAFGWITPVGGSAWLAGWLLLAWGIIPRKEGQHS